jgi:quinol monooxygenase YgiN
LVSTAPSGPEAPPIDADRLGHDFARFRGSLPISSHHLKNHTSQEIIMNAARVCRLLLVSSVFCTSFAVPSLVRAQKDDSGKVLVIEREFTKPGKDGAVHEATEAAYIRAVQANKGNIHYVAFTSVSGVNRALFVSSYPSMAAVEAERMATSPALAAAMDKAMVADGDTLNETGASVWMRRDDLSTNVSAPPTGTRLLEVRQFVLKPGHEHEFEQAAKAYVEGAKGVPEFHWTTYEMAYGTSDGPTYIVLTAMKSATEIDAGFAAGPRFDEALGESGQKKIAELMGASVEKDMVNLFVVNPKMSIPTDEMIQSEPTFWRPKMSASAAKKPAAKAAAASGQ